MFIVDLVRNINIDLIFSLFSLQAAHECLAQMITEVDKLFSVS